MHTIISYDTIPELFMSYHMSRYAEAFEKQTRNIPSALSLLVKETSIRFGTSNLESPLL